MQTSPAIFLLYLLCLVEPGLQLPQSQQAYAASLGRVSVGLYGRDPGIYAASLGDATVGLYSRFGFPRSYGTWMDGRIFEGIIYPPRQPTVSLPKLPPYYPQDYVPDRKTYLTKAVPKIVDRLTTIKSTYGNSPDKPQQQSVRVEAFASAKIQSPSGSAVSVSRSSANSTNAESKAISFQGQEILQDVR